MKPNRILTEIRQTRDDLARGVKFVSPAPRKKETADSLREEPPKPK